ncbi:DUF2203 domain-containing protein [Ferroacidibacillus organovorans]|uniref:Cell division protein DivIVA n=1 Tax=Ferroacidibacillus organovorans TaxID=1765683 RepID=A0A162TD04_9BACL|nr:DUF2203 domain-containing protein [Ferroacidibacillus organovorans]KYP80681.1 hypothetical protein AYJ22_10310 [Ferroacidibacillus organovorans]OAG93280.1 hypothetical protein AYW79_11465 [Ferroacidibacillus organovorans]OPG15923.1 hypothetical protein B2M26_10020 [Ferroacidibacillus organovorans]
MTKRYYSLREANDLLPALREQIAELKRTREEITIRRLSIERKKREIKSVAPDEFFLEEAEIEFMLITARQQIDHLEAQSIFIKDIDAGLIDFLTRIGGRDGYLCWRNGEPSIRFWHGIEEGFSSRKPLYDQGV